MGTPSREYTVDDALREFGDGTDTESEYSVASFVPPQPMSSRIVEAVSKASKAPARPAAPATPVQRPVSRSPITSAKRAVGQGVSPIRPSGEEHSLTGATPILTSTISLTERQRAATEARRSSIEDVYVVKSRRSPQAVAGEYTASPRVSSRHINRNDVFDTPSRPLRSLSTTRERRDSGSDQRLRAEPSGHRTPERAEAATVDEGAVSVKRTLHKESGFLSESSDDGEDSPPSKPPRPSPGILNSVRRSLASLPFLRGRDKIPLISSDSSDGGELFHKRKALQRTFGAHDATDEEETGGHERENGVQREHLSSVVEEKVTQPDLREDAVQTVSETEGEEDQETSTVYNSLDSDQQQTAQMEWEREPERSVDTTARERDEDRPLSARPMADFAAETWASSTLGYSRRALLEQPEYNEEEISDGEAELSRRIARLKSSIGSHKSPHKKYDAPPYSEQKEEHKERKPAGSKLFREDVKELDRLFRQAQVSEQNAPQVTQDEVHPWYAEEHHRIDETAVTEAEAAQLRRRLSVAEAASVKMKTKTCERGQSAHSSQRRKGRDEDKATKALRRAIVNEVYGCANSSSRKKLTRGGKDVEDRVKQLLAMKYSQSLLHKQGDSGPGQSTKHKSRSDERSAWLRQFGSRDDRKRRPRPTIAPKTPQQRLREADVVRELEVLESMILNRDRRASRHAPNGDISDGSSDSRSEVTTEPSRELPQRQRSLSSSSIGRASQRTRSPPESHSAAFAKWQHGLRGEGGAQERDAARRKIENRVNSCNAVSKMAQNTSIFDRLNIDESERFDPFSLSTPAGRADPTASSLVGPGLSMSLLGQATPKAGIQEPEYPVTQTYRYKGEEVTTQKLRTPLSREALVRRAERQRQEEEADAVVMDQIWERRQRREALKTSGHSRAAGIRH